MTVIFLVPCEIRLPAGANRHREPRSCFELILDIEEVLPLYGIAAGLAEGDAQLIEVTQQEVGHGISGLRTAEGYTAPVGELTVESKIHLVHFVTPFQRMAAVDPRHRLAQVPVDVILRVRISGVEIEVAADAGADALTVQSGGQRDAEAGGSVLLVRV